MTKERTLTEQELAKVDAETTAIVRRMELDAEKNAAEVRKIEAEARTAELAGRINEIELAQKARAEAEQLTADMHFNRYAFTESVGANSVTTCMRRLSHWTRMAEMDSRTATIELVFTSPGGSVIEGLALFDFIRELQRRGHVINTNTLGMAASMAGILLQVGNTRSMAKEAWILIHEISTAIVGKIGEIEDEVELVKHIQKRVLNIFAERSKEAYGHDPVKHPKPLVVTQLAKKWRRKDWWLSSDEALRHGIVDDVV